MRSETTTVRQHLTQEYGQFIEEYGRLIQHYAEESYLYVQLLKVPNTSSTDLYPKVVQLHVNATQVHRQATQMYTRLIQQQMKKIKR